MKPLYSIALISFLIFNNAGAEETKALVILFGDSITVGFNSGRRVDFGNGSTTLSGPTEFLSTILNNEDEPRPSTVVNWGVGGSSSFFGMQRLSGTVALTQGSVPHDQCFVLIIYGTNDFGHGIGASTTVFNNQQMIRQTRAMGCTPLIGNLTPRSDRDLAPLSSDITSIAQLENTIVVDQFGSFIQHPLADLLELEISFLSGRPIRLHPNDTGYQLLVQNWFNQGLRSLISPVESPPIVIAPIVELLLDD